MRLIPYAGFDPDENVFDEPAPVRRKFRHRLPRAYRTALDVDRIHHLRRLGWTWRAIGEQLAKEDGRRVPYLGTSIWWAARYATPRAPT